MSIFTGDNLFEIRRTGVLINTSRTTAFSNEPTGVALNSGNGHFFFTDDDTVMIYEVDPGGDGVLDTSDDVVGSFSTAGFGSFDPQDVTWDNLHNVLFSVDGDNAEVYRISPGPNGVFDGVSPAGDDQVSQFDTTGLGVLNPEGITFDPASGHLFILGKQPAALAEVTTDGVLLRTIDVSAVPFVAPGGVAVAPGSLDPSGRNLYITDQGLDSNAGSIKNDGRVYEIAVPTETQVNAAPSVSAGPDRTIALGQSVALNGSVTDDGLPNPPGEVTTDWVRVSGPGLVVFADSSAVDTTAAFSETGTYVLRLSASDGELIASDDVTISVTSPGGGGGSSVSVPVTSSSDDAEEDPSGSVNLTSTDLELTFDKSVQIVGMRFRGIEIPQGTTIESAYIQFQVDEPTSEATSLTVQGESRDNPAAFTTSARNISNRPRTTAAVAWAPPPWPTVGAASLDQRSPDIAAVIQEIVDRPGWASGNAMAIIITGSGKRVAESFNGDSSAAPLLHVVWSSSMPEETPTISSFSPASGEPATIVTVQGNNFLGTSEVTINGTPAEFLAVSNSELQAIVPPGATSGAISVGSSVGSASSADDFLVLPSSMVLVGAGDMATCLYEEDEATASLLDGIPGIVFALGDNTYENGTAEEYANCYDPPWGRHKARTRPTPGNHDYNTPGAAPYYSYFGLAAGDPLQGYYSYDMGTWHIVVFNSECAEVGGCEADSPQGQWLQADLASHPSDCTLAYWHDPLYTSGVSDPDPAMQDFWEILYSAGAEVVLNGHSHGYERFAPQNPYGVADPEGIREFVVGTGGYPLHAWERSEPNTEVRNNKTFGVLKLTLHPSSYDWEFIPIPGQSFSDSGTGLCSDIPLDTTAPSVTAFDIPTTSSSLTVPINTFSATDDTAVTGYLATESASAPAAGDPGWSTLAPTSYTYATEGAKTLYGWAKDAAGNVSTSLSDMVTIALPSDGNTFVYDVQVRASWDDGEEKPNGSLYLTSTDLELIEDKQNQTVGIRFRGIDIPRGASIIGAYVQFQVDEATSVATSLEIRGEATDNASTFSKGTYYNISSRPRTAAAVLWSPMPWLTVGEAGPAQRTSDISAVIQEIVNRPGWSRGNALAIIITGSGKRVAESFEGDPEGAPLLHVVYR